MTTQSRLVIIPKPASKELLDHFISTEWCAQLLANSDYTVIDIPKRAAASNNEETLMTQTLSTDRTIRASLSLYKSPADDDLSSACDTDVGEVYTLNSLGSGLNGNIDICHGGFVAILLDDVMALLGRHDVILGKPVTVTLNIKFRRPVPTPSIVLCRARFTKFEGRKAWITGTVEDGMGTIYAVGEGLFIAPKPKL